MQYVHNIDIDKWVRPWEVEKFDELRDKDERFFSIVVKGALNYLNNHIYMYNKPIRHFINDTNSSFMYIESNGYDFSWSETTGEDWMYMEMPRCIVELGNFSIPQAELTSPFVRGVYERKSSKDGQMHGYNAELRRLPIEMTMKLTYVLSNFNESIILIQELFDKLIFQRYFSIIYLGQRISCSIQFSENTNIDMSALDMASTENNQKTISFDIIINTNYPIIDVRTESPNDRYIESFRHDIHVNPGYKSSRIYWEDDKYHEG